MAALFSTMRAFLPALLLGRAVSAHTPAHDRGPSLGLRPATPSDWSKSWRLEVVENGAGVTMESG